MPAWTAACWRWTRTSSGRSAPREAEPRASGRVLQRGNLVEPVVAHGDDPIALLAIDAGAPRETAERRQHGQAVAQPEAWEPEAVVRATADAHGRMQVPGQRVRAGH